MTSGKPGWVPVVYADPISLDTLVDVYLRFRQWYLHDVRRTAHCSMEVVMMQSLFKASYVDIPEHLVGADYERLIAASAEAVVLRDRFGSWAQTPNDEVDMSPADWDALGESLHTELSNFIFHACVDPIKPLMQVMDEDVRVFEATAPVGEADPAESFEEMANFWDDHNDADTAALRQTLIEDFPGIERLRFDRERLFERGLPRIPPNPIDPNVEDPPDEDYA